MKKNDLTPTVVEIVGNHVKLTTHDAFASGQMINLVHADKPGDMQNPDYECGIWVPICKSVGQNEQEAAEIVSTMTITGIL